MCCTFRCCGREGKANTKPTELLAILKVEINSVSDENLLREFEGITVGVEKVRARLHVD